MQERKFFNKLFDKAVWWREEDGDWMVTKFGPQKIKYWTREETVSQPFHLKRGIVLRNSKYDSAFALGVENVLSPKRNNETLVFHFGIWHRSLWEDINQSQFSRYFSKLYRGSGRFYVEPVLETPELDCFADLGEWGGKGVHNWPRNRFVTEEGLNECMSLLKAVGHLIMRETYKSES